jgi:hypothetical protein
MRHTITRTVAGTVAAGLLALGTAGVAGAATPAAGTTATAPLLTPGNGRLAHFDCTRAPHVLARIQKAEARIASGLPKLTAAEARAAAAGETGRADRIQKVITRLESPTLTSRLHKLVAAVEAKCNVAVPPTTTAPAPGT